MWYSVIQFGRVWFNNDQCGTVGPSIEPSVCKKSVVASGLVAGRELTDLACGLCHGGLCQGGSNLLLLLHMWLVACVMVAATYCYCYCCYLCAVSTVSATYCYCNCS